MSNNSDLGGDSSGDNKLSDLNNLTSSSQMGNLSRSRREEEEANERKETEQEELSTKAAAECLLGLANTHPNVSSTAATTTTSSENNTKGAKRKREETITTSVDIKPPPPTKRPAKKNYCKYEDCPNQAHKGGVCIKHGM